MSSLKSFLHFKLFLCCMYTSEHWKMWGRNWLSKEQLWRLVLPLSHTCSIMYIHVYMYILSLFIRLRSLPCLDLYGWFELKAAHFFFKSDCLGTCIVLLLCLSGIDNGCYVPCKCYVHPLPCRCYVVCVRLPLPLPSSPVADASPNSKC